MLMLSLMVMASILATHSQSVEEVFKSHGVVPDIIPEAPNQFLQVTYSNGLTVKEGKELTPTQVKDEPAVEWNAEPDAFYTLLLTDPDAPSRKEPKFREWHHWLVGNIPGNQIKQGEELSGYIGAGPPQGTGLHRYIFLVFKQPKKLTFNEPRIPKTNANNREKFSTLKFVEKYNLGNPVAGNFFEAQYDDYVPILFKKLTGN